MEQELQTRAETNAILSLSGNGAGSRNLQKDQKLLGASAGIGGLFHIWRVKTRKMGGDLKNRSGALTDCSFLGCFL